ncbi:hypothetical protein [Variovorax sp. PBL-E5]|uniref:hypothetical protein n=1 Tax=Variovorax sp. PBL-E5 TaxID=434014 RepID=UPI001319595C|nr:hypothetical protein [Variovorax sp. PBL-E5]VTU28404.1 hypothetical protein E5CHR_02602 [Variovorax sp. PBL-E5]
MKLTKAQFAAWEINEADPDNWLKIPEFDVLPRREERYYGFEHPILTLGDDEESYRGEIRKLVKRARAELRRVFPTLRESLESRIAALELVSDEELAEAPRWDAKQRAAMQYFFIMIDLEFALRHAQPGHQVATFISRAATTLIDWIDGGPLKAATYEKMIRSARVGGLASAVKRRASSKVPAPERLRQERQKLVEEGKGSRDVASILAKRYGCSADHIRKQLRKENQMRLNSVQDASEGLVQ